MLELLSITSEKSLKNEGPTASSSGLGQLRKLFNNLRSYSYKCGINRTYSLPGAPLGNSN